MVLLIWTKQKFLDCSYHSVELVFKHFIGIFEINNHIIAILDILTLWVIKKCR